MATALTKLVIERGYQPFVVIRPQNEASRCLYTKLGFEKVYETCRVKMTPNCLQTNGAHEPTAPEFEVDDNKENKPIDEGIEDMLAEKCDISKGNEAASQEKFSTTDEGIEEDK